MGSRPVYCFYQLFRAYARFAEYFKFMLEHGIYSAPSQFEAMFVSCAHSDEDIEKTCEVVREYFSK